MRVFHGADSEDFVILACAVLIESQSVTDGRTGGQTHGRCTDPSPSAKTGFCYAEALQKLMTGRHKPPVRLVLLPDE